MNNIKYIGEENKALIAGADDIVTTISEYVSDFQEIRSTGKWEGTCPKCGKKKLQANTKKELYKCFYAGCEVGGKTGVSFLMQAKGMEYVEASLAVAEAHNIELKETAAETKKKKPVQVGKFVENQLRESGIKPESIKYFSSPTGKSKKQYELTRYSAGTVSKAWDVLTDGDDMILHYLDLKGEPITYQRDGKGVTKNYIRVRRANPELHKNKKGDGMKYQSPWGSKSQLWLPQLLIAAYSKGVAAETLYVIEGEKKADAMCQAGLMTVGIGGIHNFDFNNMPYQFELMIKRFEVKNVVFVLDADWQDISISSNKIVDMRPRTFYSAVRKFQKYFYAYHKRDIDLNIYFGYNLDPAFKGMDDVFVRSGAKAEDIAQDWKNAMIDRQGEGDYVHVHEITDMSSYKLLRFWKLHDKDEFAALHGDKLKGIGKFKFSNIEHRLNASGQMELIDQIMPGEQFWEEKVREVKGETQKSISFRHVEMRYFLQNRDYGTYQHNEGEYRFIHKNGRIVREVNAIQIRKFVQNYIEANKRKDVLEMLLRGGKQYLGPEKLTEMYEIEPEFFAPMREKQYMIFKNKYWEITAEGVSEHNIEELPGYVWKEQVIDFEPKITEGKMIEANLVDGKWKVYPNPELIEQCDIAQFYVNTSNFHWRKEQKLIKDKKGVMQWVDKKKDEKEEVSLEELDVQNANLIAKMIAAGYMTNDFIDYSELRAVIAMDGEDSEVNKSKGGTGKGIFCTQFEHLKNVFLIDGKNRKLFDNDFLYDGVDERTNIIYFEDVRPNFDFKAIYPLITRGPEVNGKGVKKFRTTPKRVIIDTNHAINGDDTSTIRRQFFINFSDYYNEHRRVGDDFGHQFFHDWDYHQWNLFYNWLAVCQQMYLKFGLKHKVNEESIARRRVRQQIGEEFIKWAELQYSTEPDASGNLGQLLNRQLEEKYAMNLYLEYNHLDARWLKPSHFKDKLKAYAKFAGLTYNPQTEGRKDDRIRNNAKSYVVLANDDFKAAEAAYINDDGDLISDLKKERDAKTELPFG